MNLRADITLIERVSADLADMLGDDFDADAFWDTLDGETDVLDVADHLLNSMFDDEALADAIKAREADMKVRRDRIEARAKAKRRTLLTILDATGQKKMERPLATVSRRSGSMSVQITDEDAIPTQLKTVKTVTSPDKAAIKAQIEAGEDVPGAALVRGEDGVTVRVK